MDLVETPRRQPLQLTLDSVVLVGAAICLFAWFIGHPLFYTDLGPVMSPFTALSLLGMSWIRIAEAKIDTWGKPMSLAILGIIACGNASNILMLSSLPSLVLNAMPALVPTSIFTSVGLLLFCLYQTLLLIRPTPKSYFILDDVLIHLALFPGGLSLLGHLLDSPTYLSSSVDPRVGIGLFEMAFMGVFAASLIVGNKDLFLWRFLQKRPLNKVVFGLLFLNQYIAPTAVGLLTLEAGRPNGFGIEFFVMLAGVLATLSFLVLNAIYYNRQPKAAV